MLIMCNLIALCREREDEGRVIKVAYRSLLSLYIWRPLEYENKSAAHFHFELSLELNSLKLQTHMHSRNMNIPYCSLFPDSGS